MVVGRISFQATSKALLDGKKITQSKVRGVWDFAHIEGRRIGSDVFRLLKHDGVISEESEVTAEDGTITKTFGITTKGKIILQ